MAGGVMGDYFFLKGNRLACVHQIRKPEKLYDVWVEQVGYPKPRVPGTRGTYRWDGFYGAIEAQFDMYLYIRGVGPKEVSSTSRIVCLRKPKKMCRRGSIQCYMHNLGYELRVK